MGLPKTGITFYCAFVTCGAAYGIKGLRGITFGDSQTRRRVPSATDCVIFITRLAKVKVYLG